MDKSAIEKLYTDLLNSWNKHDAKEFASFFAEDGNTVGFDGSQMNGKKQIESELAQIFANHETAHYVRKVKEVRFLSPDVALLRAVVGMIPPNQTDINSNTNAIQSLVAVRDGEVWRIALFHNTPAQFHGRPELVESLTSELRELLPPSR